MSLRDEALKVMWDHDDYIHTVLIEELLDVLLAWLRDTNARDHDGIPVRAHLAKHLAEVLGDDDDA